jgi:hypothetical protein
MFELPVFARASMHERVFLFSHRSFGWLDGILPLNQKAKVKKRGGHVREMTFPSPIIWFYS